MAKKQQLIDRVKKLHKEKGSISLNGMFVPMGKGGTGLMIELDKICVDDGDLGAMCSGGRWFIPLDELTYRELEKIIKMY